MPFKRPPTQRLSAEELAEIDELEWLIACLHYDLNRLQHRDDYEAAQDKG